MDIFEHEDLDRILALPTRLHDWSESKTEQAVRLVTDWLRTPEGTYDLKPIQARALVEIHDYRRLVGIIGAGEGKALLSFLIPTVLKAQRTLIIVPAKLRRQTFAVHEQWSHHFRIPQIYGVEDTLPATGPIIRVQSYESLGHINYAAFIEEYEPDLIICDESHFLARLSAGRSKRIFRYIRNRRKVNGFNAVTFVPMSGTIWRKSIREAAHIFEAALGDMSPLPTEYTVLEQMAFCLDEGVKHDLRNGPGPLLRLLRPDEEPCLDSYRRALRRRMVNSPGVVATSETSIGIPLILQVRPIVVPEVIREAMATLRAEHLLPSGDDAGDPLQVWAHTREIAAGFAYYPDPPPPEPYREARRKWNGFVRDRISDGGQSHWRVWLGTRQPVSFREEQQLTPHIRLSVVGTKMEVFWNGNILTKMLHGETYRMPDGTSLRAEGSLPLDTPLQVWNAAEAGRFGDCPEFDEWKAVRYTFEPHTKPKWLSDYLLRDAEEWALKTKGIVWVGHAAAYTEGESDDDTMGTAFTKIPYFGAGDNRIEKYRGPCAASIRSHGTGKNLTQWNEALMLLPPSSGAALEQLLARLHREGQKEDTVTYYTYQHSLEAVKALVTAKRDAQFMESTTGNPQRILTCAILNEDGSVYSPEKYLDELEDSEDPMFAKPDVSDPFADFPQSP